MSFQLLFEDWQGSSIPDGKIIPPARNSEREYSGEWFWASLWWYHEASLTSRSQTSGGDLDRHQWVEVGGCWACGCSICKHHVLNLMWAATGSQCKEIKRGVIIIVNCIVMYISVPPGFCDSAITEFIAKSCKLRNFCKNSHIFIITADFRRFWA